MMRQQCGFSATGCADQANKFTLRDRQVDRRQRLDFVIADRKAFW